MRKEIGFLLANVDKQDLSTQLRLVLFDVLSKCLAALLPKLAKTIV
jgi:hypothetical protein